MDNFEVLGTLKNRQDGSGQLEMLPRPWCVAEGEPAIVIRGGLPGQVFVR